MLSYQQQKKRSRIGTVLVRKGLISPNQLDYAIRLQAETQSPLGQILTDKYFITDRELHSALSQQSLLRIFAMLIAFALTPFQLTHAETSPSLTPSTAEGMERVGAAYNQSQLNQQLNKLWDNYDKLLTTYVSASQKQKLDANMVNYNQLRRDPNLRLLIDALEKFPASEIESNDQQIAFYLNAYNILAINMVVKNWPLKKINSLGGVFESVWDKPAGVIDGKTVTLGEVEHDILRKFGEPRVHFAMNCASMSCPNLRVEAYRADKLETQLDNQVTIFLNQEHKGVHRKGDTLYVSKIFKWFAADFTPHGGIEQFIRHYKPNLPNNIDVEPSLSYNWNINCHLTSTNKRNLN